MSKYSYSEDEQKINNVLMHQSKSLSDITFPEESALNRNINDSEALLTSLGYSLKNVPRVESTIAPKTIVVPTWEELCKESEAESGTILEDLFTKEELDSNEKAIILLNNEFNALYKLDKFDVIISAVAGILGAAIDILLVGIPVKSAEGIKGGPLSNYVREWFDKKFPPEEMEKLANSKISKVPYDAQDNRHTTEYVNGLSAYYHRLISLGHDPLLGLIFGVFDIMTGRMTTIDKTGKFVSQVMENYADRKESNIFAAIAKQIIHFKSDITTSMGLPVPLMSLFNLLQFGSIGEEEQTIAEIVQGMYFEGYDFIHFCSMSIPTMLIEVVVRMGYAIKRIKEGYSVKESIPFSLDRLKNPKLSTMLFISHSAATAANAGKVFFSKNPMAINYPQWISFGKYSYKQLKWVLVQKPELQSAYVDGTIIKDLKVVYAEIDNTFAKYSDEYNIVFS